MRWTFQAVIILLTMLAAAADVPDSVCIQGVLTDAEGAPLTGTRVYGVQYYDAESGGNPLGGTLNGSVAVEASGQWCIVITPPAEVIDATGEVWYALGIDFLRAVNSYESVPVGHKAVIVGGGNVAMDCARSALRLGVGEVHLVYRRSREDMPADPLEIREAEEEGVRFHFQTNPVRILSDDGGQVAGMECISMELGAPDESGRRRPVPMPGTEHVISTDTVIFSIGQAAGLSFIPEDSQVGTTSWGTIVAGKLNDEPIDYPGRELEEEFRNPNASLPHVVGEHRTMQEAHVYEDAMQLVDWVRENKPTIVTAEHARHVIEIFDAAYRSAQSGQAQALRSSFQPIS